MITKSLRLALIATACAKLGTAQKVAAVLNPSAHDVREEIALARETDNGALPVDDDLPVLSPSLSFEIAVETEESEYVLSLKERRLLARDLTDYRIRRDLSASRNPFALAIV